MNQSFFNLINGFAGKSTSLDRIGVMVAEYLPLLLLAFLFYLWFFRKELRGEVLLTCYTILVAMSMNFFITLIYFHPRPFMEKTVNLLIRHAPETSFPSDHATFMFALSFPLLCCKNLRPVGILFIIMSVAGGLARVYCGVHYPLDICGSVMVALAAVGLTRFLMLRPLTSLNHLILHHYDTFTEKLHIAKIH